MGDSQLRKLSAALGVATTIFGAVPAISPALFAKTFGLRGYQEPTVEAAFRSIGARDVAIGLGIWSAAAHGGNYAPWLLARAICDGGDTLAALAAVRRGERDPRFLILTAMAVGATAADIALHLLARSRRR